MERGQRVGLIKFGSRTDMILPAEAEYSREDGAAREGRFVVLAAMPEPELCGASPPERSAERQAEVADGEAADVRP